VECLGGAVNLGQPHDIDSIGEQCRQEMNVVIRDSLGVRSEPPEDGRDRKIFPLAEDISANSITLNIQVMVILGFVLPYPWIGCRP
jgi:hypothetical protein